MPSDIISPKSHKKILILSIVIFVIIFLISSLFFIKDILKVRQKGTIHPRNPMGIIFSGGKIPDGTGALDIESIEPWMTFSYINFRFHLPESFLQEKLSLHDPRYPNIPIRTYIKKNNLNGTVFIQELKDIIRPIIHNNPQ